MDERLNEAQQEVKRLMGRCVLRLQQYEVQLKAILAYQDVSGELRSKSVVRAARLAEVSRQTLGSLVKAFVGSVLVNGEPAAIDEGEDDEDQGPPRFRMVVRLGMSDEDFAQTKAELRELVQLRNELIHHFMEKHDLWTMEGCRTAQEDLMAVCDRIGTHVARLRESATDLERVLQEASQTVRSEALQETVVNGILPDGTVFWPGAGLVLALRQAAQALDVDGWAEISAAARWIAEHFPDQTPEKYGCVSMRQVVHQSGEFDLCILERNGIRRRHFRLRDDDHKKGGGQIAHLTISFE
ncbi:OST-HTH/LOTUS domain-containing protein [Rhodobacter sp. SY28-1]|uniref:OST-HTH/LOTUS domain-containing protein n=1 Tax=Rhodobacter sp. SY28-1 TaxID=2562317 RepID=UPI0010BFCBCC|nr:OST-HTH/LOTUS domain-containing protein [Rhodobacter sp. SY28-1]